MNDYRFEYHDALSPSHAFGIFIKDNQNNVLGEITGFIYSDCIHIDVLYVNQELQGLGFGKKLLERAEKIGLDRGCNIATVHTMDFEAPEFYQKLGYEIEFIRESHDKTSKMYILQKNLK